MNFKKGKRVAVTCKKLRLALHVVKKLRVFKMEVCEV